MTDLDRFLCQIILWGVALPMFVVFGLITIYMIGASVWSMFKRCSGRCYNCLAKDVPLQTVDFGCGMTHYAIDLCESCERGEAPC